VTLANLDQNNLQELSMIELAIIVLENKKKALNYREIFDQVAEMKGFSETEKSNYLAQFYTDINLDGRLLTLGGGEWGLKKWYSVDQIDEVIKVETTPKKRKKKKKKVKKDDEEEVESSIDDQDDDLTEVPLDIIGKNYKNDQDDEEDTLTLDDEDLIDEEDYDEYEEDEEDLDDDEYEDEEDEEDEEEYDRE